MEYQVRLNTGDKFNVVDDKFSVKSFTEEMNNQQVICVNIGGSAIMKHAFVSVVPVDLINKDDEIVIPEAK